MPNIQLGDNIYEGVNVVRMNTTDGNAVDFVAEELNKPALVCFQPFDSYFDVGAVVTRTTSDFNRAPKVGEAFTTICASKYYTVFEVTEVSSTVYKARVIQTVELVGGSELRVAEIELLAANWVGNTSPYSQVVVIPGVTNCSQVDLTPSVEQLAIFHDKDLAFVTENEDGVVTVYAIGQKPTNDYTMQVTIKEVIA